MIRLHKRFRLLLTILITSLILISCNRIIPAASPDLLKEKKSLLLVTAASVSKEETDLIGKTLQASALSEQIAFEWVAQASGFDAELSARVKTKPYDRVIVIGDELFSGAVEAAKAAQDKQFSLYQASHAPFSAAVPELPNLKLVALNGSGFTAQWDDWVRSQRELGANILWINRSQAPVPSAWAPSEEAEAIFSIDLYPDNEWFPQLSFQARSIQANWIVLYTSLEPAVINRIKTLRIPIMDMNGGIKVEYEWKTIVQNELRSLKSADWQPGTAWYADQDVRLSRK